MAEQTIELNDFKPLEPDHICFERGHAMFEVSESDNGRSKWGEKMCSRCGERWAWQWDYN